MRVQSIVGLKLKLWAAACALLVVPCAARTADAQRDTVLLPVAVPVGSELEQLLRTLQLVDPAGLQLPWSVRGFSPAELRQLAPMGERAGESRGWRFAPVTGRTAAPHVQLMPASARLWFNSSFPFGTNDGPVWRGRGFTAQLSGGFAAVYGPVSLVISPVMFVAENRAFELMPTGLSGNGIYADPARVNTVDRPQRFGDAAYSAFDPGESTLRVDAGPVTVGASTANMWWGPMAEYPFILGNNAAGFPHIFLGSATPLNVGIGRVHARYIVGNLSQSAFAVDTGLAARRFASGLVGVFMPRGVPGLELGAGRFFHTPAREGGPSWRDFTKPLETFLKSGITTGGDAVPGDITTDRDNQLASVFFRWVLPRGGLEVYGEYGREDHNGGTTDFLLEPDHIASYGLGFARAWRPQDGMVTLRGEMMTIDPSILARHRPEGTTYTHFFLHQGHTQRGQLLGAGFGAYWGSAARLSLERYQGSQRSALELSRAVVRERNSVSGFPDPSIADLDVQYALTASRSRAVGHLELGWEATGVYELNRDLQRRSTWALNGGLRLGWW